MGVKDRDWYWKKYDEIERMSRRQTGWKAFRERVRMWLRRWGF